MPVSKRRIFILLAIISVGALMMLAACGGNQTSAQPTTTPTSVTDTTTPTVGDTPTQAAQSPTATPVPPTATPIPPTATPVPQPVQPTPTPRPQPTPKPNPTTVVVSISTDSSGSFIFSPALKTISVGTTVVWNNLSRVGHTVVADGGAFVSPVIPAGGSYSFTFTKTGTFAYHCSIHPYMTASITVQ